MSKKIFNWLSSILLGVIFLIIWIKIVDWQEFMNYFKQFDLVLVVVFSIFYLLAYFLRSLRWRLILKPIYKMKISESFKIFMAGMLINYLIPIRAGEVAKSVILKTNKNINISTSLPTIFIDKLTDLFPILLIMFLIPLISVQLNSALYTIISLLFLIFLIFLLFLYFAVKHKSKANKMLSIFLKIIPKHYRDKFEKFVENFIDGMAVMQNRFYDNIIIYILTFMAVLSEAVYIYFVFKAFGAEISYVKILFGYTLMNLTYILPTPPAQIGSNQFMWVLIFSFALGVNENLTSAAVTFSHLLTTIWILLIGFISLATMKINLKEIYKGKKI